MRRRFVQEVLQLASGENQCSDGYRVLMGDNDDVAAQGLEAVFDRSDDSRRQHAERFMCIRKVGGVLEVGLKFTRHDRRKLLPDLPYPPTAQVPLAEALVRDDVEAVSLCDRRCRVHSPRQRRTDDGADSVIGEIATDRVGFEYAIGVEIESGEVRVYDVVRVRYLAMPDEHDGCRCVHG